MNEGSGRERVRCSSLVDWPVYPRLRRTMRGSGDGRFILPRRSQFKGCKMVFTV